MPKPLALVIEDQFNLVTLYEDALRLVGYNVHSIQDGLKALNYLETNDTPPNLIILDVNLPSLSGYDLHTHIRKRGKYADTPVMILTANSLMAQRIRPKVTENDHLYIKPISISQLQSLARSMRPDPALGKPEYMAETRPVPTLEEIEQADQDDNETLKGDPLISEEVLRPDDTLTEETVMNTRLNTDTGDSNATILRPDNSLGNDAINNPTNNMPVETQDDITILSPEDAAISQESDEA